MKNIKEIKIFLASPGDLILERNIVFETVDELNTTICHHNNINLKVIDWEKFTYPGLGEDGQDVINKQLDDDYDIFLCLFWKKIGTPTKRAKSGTIEELNNALQKYQNGQEIEIMLYFKNEAVDFDQIDKSIFEIKKIKEKVKKLGLYKEFKTTLQFQKIFRMNLTHYLYKNHIDKNKIVKSNENQNNTKTIPHKLEILTKLESLDLDSSKSSNIIDSIETLENHNSKYVSQLKIISDITIKFGKNINNRTSELKKYNGIKDRRLKLKKIKENINEAAKDFDNISMELEKKTPNFVITSDKVMQSYYDFYLAIGENDNKDVEFLISSMEKTINSVGEMIISVNNLPELTPQFTNSKIRVIKNFKLIINTIADGYYILKSI